MFGRYGNDKYKILKKMFGSCGNDKYRETAISDCPKVKNGYVAVKSGHPRS